MKETEMQGRARKLWEDLPEASPDSVPFVLAEFAREELLSAARDLRLEICNHDSCGPNECDYKVVVAEWLERRAKQ